MGSREYHQVANRSEPSPESLIKLTISQAPPIYPETYLRFGKVRKIKNVQPVNGGLPVTECRQKETQIQHNLKTGKIKEKSNARKSENCIIRPSQNLQKYSFSN